MGTLYREEVKYRNLKTSKFLLKLLYTILIIDIAFILYILEGTIEKTIYVGLSIAVLGALGSAFLRRICKTRYRYGIIDRELIIERFNGHRRKVELNINLSHIKSINKVRDERESVNVEEEYTFTCNGAGNSVYRCVYEMNGRLYSFIFEPSPALLKKIEMYR